MLLELNEGGDTSSVTSYFTLFLSAGFYHEFSSMFSWFVQNCDNDHNKADLSRFD